MKRKNIKFMAILLIFAMMLTGCSTVEKTGVNNEINAVELEGEKLTEGESTSSESTESVSEETSSNVTENVSTESEVVEDNKSEETKEEFTESPTTETENVVEEIIEDEEIVASGFLENADVEWKIVGTTLYVSGDGAIPDFEYSALQSRNFPDVLPWDGLVGWQTYDEMVEKIVVEDGITKIGRSNFSYFKNVKEIIFADSVIEIGNYACTGLGVETINLNNITKLGIQSFGELKNLKNLTIPGTINTISKSCFTGCPNLSEIYIEEGVTTIKERAFEQYGTINCVIHLPSSLKNMVDSSLSTGMTVYVKAGSYAEQAANEYKDNSALTIIVE
jgi:hypothetical protein